MQKFCNCEIISVNRVKDRKPVPLCWLSVSTIWRYYQDQSVCKGQTVVRFTTSPHAMTISSPAVWWHCRWQLPGQTRAAT